MRVAVACLAACLLAPLARAEGESWPPAEGVHRYVFEAADPAILSRHVLVFLPRGYAQEKVPLIVFLHGAGERGGEVEKMNGKQVFKFAAEHPDFGFAVAAPHLPAEARGFDPASLVGLIDELAERLPIDRTRIYLTGLSMGANAVWQTAARYPQRFAAIVPIASRVDSATACAVKSTPVWAFHNEHDTLALIKPVEEMIEAIRACEGSARLTVYPQTGHNAWAKAYADPALYEWLAGRKR